MNTGYRQYLRKYRIIISHKGKNKGIEVSNLRAVFDVNKAVSGSPNNSNVTICNMASDTASSVKRGDTVILEAGYKDGNYGMIFSGEIVQAKISKGTDVNSALVLICQDGDKLLKSKFVCTSLSAGSTSKDVVKECLSGDSGATEGQINEQLSETALPRGKTLFGKASNYLEQVASSNSCQFYIEDGAVNIVAAEDYANNVAVELNPTTGLIGTPEQNDDGVTAQCLINPSLKLNSMVHISSSLIEEKTVSKSEKPKKLSADGIYKITKINYIGDTHGDDWYCKFEGVLVAGKTVSGKTGNQTNIWR